MFSTLLHKISRFDSNLRLAIAIGAAVLTFFVTPAPIFSPLHTTIVWIVFSATISILAWIAIFISHPRELPHLSRMEDSSRLLILLFAVGASIASIIAVIFLLGSSTKEAPDHSYKIGLSILAVINAWILVHTVFTLRYAHLYYGNSPNLKKPPGGLNFPDESEPDYLDFAYFSFVIGMTSQVSDVSISSKTMRRTALVHGLLSFTFNAIIIALTISGLSSSL